MPIWLRNLTYKKLDEYYTKKKPTDPNKIDFENPDKSKLPKIKVPSYVTKASRK